MRPCLMLLVCASTLDAVLQSPESVEMEAGSTVGLKCSMNGMPATYCYTVVWARVDPKTKRLVSFKNSNIANSVASEQFDCFFDIQNATVDDSGTYYCFVLHGKMVYIGSGSNVIVTQERKTALPPIEILLPSSHVHESFARLLCTIPGVLPRVRMFWVIDGQEKSGFTETVWTKDSGKILESTQNQMLVPTEQWERGAVCTCVVEFDGRNSSKTVRNGDCVADSDYWVVCYSTVVTYRVVLTILCLLSWIMAVAMAIYFRRQRKCKGLIYVCLSVCHRLMKFS